MENTEQITLLGLFRQLRSISETLRSALIARDVDGIMRAVQEQEQVVNSCRNMRTTRQPAPTQTAKEPPSAATSELRSLMADIQRLQRTNQCVASAFLEAVDLTLNSLGVGAPRRRVTYGLDGWSRAPSTPVLFHQRG